MGIIPNLNNKFTKSTTLKHTGTLFALYTFMRRAFTLIELIFTIVIMAGIFSVIPKIVFATAKSEHFAMKQEALFTTVSLTNIASLLAWDEKNTETVSILETNSSNSDLECNKTTHMRQGGFLSEYARSCQEDANASVIGIDSGEAIDDYLSFDDIDDFNDSKIDVDLNAKTKYQIFTEVSYLDDDIFSPPNDGNMTIALKSTTKPTTTNIKKFKATIYSKKSDTNISSFFYYSTNIGQITLNSEEW